MTKKKRRRKKLPSWEESITTKEYPEFLSEDYLKTLRAREEEIEKIRRRKTFRQRVYGALDEIEKAFGDTGKKYKEEFKSTYSGGRLGKQYKRSLGKILSGLKRVRISAGPSVSSDRGAVMMYGSDLERNLKRETKKLKRVAEKQEAQYEKEFRKREEGSLFTRIMDYLTGKRKKTYLVLVTLFLVYLTFKNKGSVIGYTIIETATGNYLSYFLVFVLVVCLLVFYLDKK